MLERADTGVKGPGIKAPAVATLALVLILTGCASLPFLPSTENASCRDLSSRESVLFACDAGDIAQGLLGGYLPLVTALLFVLVFGLLFVTLSSERITAAVMVAAVLGIVYAAWKAGFLR